jgi:hypothetical protein
MKPFVSAKAPLHSSIKAREDRGSSQTLKLLPPCEINTYGLALVIAESFILVDAQPERAIAAAKSKMYFFIGLT